MCFAANDGDSVIIVNVQKGEKQESSRLVIVFLLSLSIGSLMFNTLHCSLLLCTSVSSLPLSSVSCVQVELWIKEL